LVAPSLFGEEGSAWRWWWRLGACAGFVVLVGGHEYRRNVENKKSRMWITLCWYVPAVLAR
jgi:hypothetical protein